MNKVTLLRVLVHARRIYARIFWCDNVLTRTTFMLKRPVLWWQVQRLLYLRRIGRAGIYA